MFYFSLLKGFGDFGGIFFFCFVFPKDGLGEERNWKLWKSLALKSKQIFPLGSMSGNEER